MMKIRYLFAVLLATCTLTPAHAQTASVVTKAESALLIFKAKQCTTACDSVLQVQWRYGGQLFTRLVLPKATDTVRTARLSVVDSARAFYTALKPVALKPVPVAAYVAPVIPPPVVVPPVVVPPVVVPPVVVPPPVTAPASGAFVVPTPPSTFAVPFPALTGQSRRVAAGQDLQAALNTAQPGDEIVLATGATFIGNYVLPTHATGVVVVRGESYPAPGVRVDTTGWVGAIVITPNSEPAFRTAPGASGWRLVGFQIAHRVGAAYNYGIVVLGAGTETTVAAIPTDITLDRMYVHGSLTDGASRCIAFNGARLAVVDSWISECHAKGFDAQGIGGWNGTGPYLITNNRIEASGQAVMFGGADPHIANVSASDITITQNYMPKPLAWARGKWTVKATFELKHARRVLFEGNVLENHWADAQVGFAMLFQTLSDNNTAWAWTTVQDVTVRNNVIRNSTGGLNMAARIAYNGGTLPTNPTSRVLIANNLWENVGRDPVTGSAGINAQLLGDLQDVTLVNNTFTLASGGAQKVLSFDGKPQTRTSILDNVFTPSSYPIAGNSTGIGQPTLDVFMPGGLFLRNTVPGLSGALGAARGAGVDTVALNAAIKGVVR